jgi:hypothetical protein
MYVTRHHKGLLITTVALLAQAGIAYFDIKQCQRYVKFGCSNEQKKTTKGGKAEKKTDDNDTLFKRLKHLEKNIEIPTSTALRDLIWEDFAIMTTSEFLLLQSVLQDLLILQPWTHPLHYQEEQEVLKNLNFSTSKQGTEKKSETQKQKDTIKKYNFGSLQKADPSQQGKGKVATVPVNQPRKRSEPEKTTSEPVNKKKRRSDTEGLSKGKSTSSSSSSFSSSSSSSSSSSAAAAAAASSREVKTPSKKMQHRNAPRRLTPQNHEGNCLAHLTSNLSIRTTAKKSTLH